MNSLVLELQSDALDSSVSVLNLLRKTSLIAYKLDVQELHEWVKLELDGYSELSQLPDYRVVHCQLKAKNPALGLIPVIIDDVELSKLISKKPIFQSISELDYLVNENNDNFLCLQISPKQEQILYRLFGTDYALILLLPFSQVNKILEFTRNIILHWSLRLEKDGILGKNMTFSTKEKEVAHNANYHIENLYNCSSIEKNMPRTSINQSNSSIGVGVNQGEINTEKLAGTINESQSQSLVKAAAEIQSLLKQLSETYPTNTSREKNIVVGEAADQIENNQALKTKVINVLKAGGTEAFREAVDHTLVNILLATIEGWKQE